MWRSGHGIPESRSTLQPIQRMCYSVWWCVCSFVSYGSQLVNVTSELCMDMGGLHGVVWGWGSGKARGARAAGINPVAPSS